MFTASFFNNIPPLFKDTGRIALSGTLMVAATAAFVHDISMQLGLLGSTVPSAAMALLLAGSALALLVPEDHSKQQQAQIPYRS